MASMRCEVVKKGLITSTLDLSELGFNPSNVSQETKIHTANKPTNHFRAGDEILCNKQNGMAAAIK